MGQVESIVGLKGARHPRVGDDEERIVFQFKLVVRKVVGLAASSSIAIAERVNPSRLWSRTE